MGESICLNRANWDERAPAHYASLNYAVERFVIEPEPLRAGQCTANAIARSLYHRMGFADYHDYHDRVDQASA